MPATPARAKLSALFTIYARICTAINNRIALSEERLLDFQGGQVQLRYKDYRDHDREKVMS